MNRGSHIVYGVCAAGIVVTLSKGSLSLGPVTVSTIAAAPFAIVGSFLPDIDVKNSKMRDKWKSISVIIFAPVLLFTCLALLDMFYLKSGRVTATLLSNIFPVLGLAVFNLFSAYELKHRTFTHSWYTPLVFYGLMILTCTYIGSFATDINNMIAGLFIGYASHLIADSCTTKGTWLAYPLKIRVCLLPKFMRVKTGTGSEKFFTVLVVSGTVAIIAINLGILNYISL